MIQAVDLVTEAAHPLASDYLIYPWLLPGRLTLMVGPTEIGKTTLTLDMMAACLKGGHLWDRFPCHKIDRVLYLHAEHTLATVQEAASLRGDILAGQVTVVHEFGDFGSALTRPDGTINSVLVHQLFTLATDIKPGMIIAEPISAFISSDENNNREARSVVSILAKLGAKVNAAVLTHHHVGKVHFDPEHEKPIGIAYGEARGAMAFEDAAERVIYLRRHKEGGSAIRLETPKSKGFPVSPVSLAFDTDTLKYSYTPQALAERDVIAIYDYTRKNPGVPMRLVVAHFANTWRCSNRLVYQVMKRAKKVGLLTLDTTVEALDTPTAAPPSDPGLSSWPSAASRQDHQ